MIALSLAVVSLLLALLPAVLFLRNLRLYRVPDEPADGRPIAVSLLIPARNEAAGIRQTLEAAMASRGVELEIIVLDDHSEDDTPRLVEELAATVDPASTIALRLEAAPALPDGWCGKQHACWVLAQKARHPTLAFLDADVRLRPDGLRRAVSFLDASGADLVSGVPHQGTVTPMEKLLIPLIHFVLLGFLPIARMRRSRSPAYGAGCGQLMIAQRAAYEQAGGHQTIRETLHDGIRLPRAFRAAGLATDLFDATPLATCRMYRSAAEVWSGLAKNAIEGLAAPATIVPATLLLAGGQVTPFVLAAFALGGWLPPAATLVATVACVLAWTPRVAAMVRFRQSPLGAALHPIGITVFLVIQWYALARWLVARPVGWRGRQYARSPGVENNENEFDE